MNDDLYSTIKSIVKSEKSTLLLSVFERQTNCHVEIDSYYHAGRITTVRMWYFPELENDLFTRKYKVVIEASNRTQGQIYVAVFDMAKPNNIMTNHYYKAEEIDNVLDSVHDLVMTYYFEKIDDLEDLKSLFDQQFKYSYIQNLQ